MTNDADLIEKYELEIWDIINKMRKEGVRFSVIHSMFVEFIKTLDMQGYTEDWFNLPK